MTTSREMKSSHFRMDDEKDLLISTEHMQNVGLHIDENNHTFSLKNREFIWEIGFTVKSCKTRNLYYVKSERGEWINVY